MIKTFGVMLIIATIAVILVALFGVFNDWWIKFVGDNIVKGYIGAIIAIAPTIIFIAAVLTWMNKR